MRIVLLLLLGISLEANAKPTLTLTLDKAIELALIQNRIVENQHLGQYLSRLDLQIAEQAFEPKYFIQNRVGHSHHYQPGVADDINNYYETGVHSSLKNRYGGTWDLALTHGTSKLGSGNSLQSDGLTLSYRQPLLKGFGEDVGTADLARAQRADTAYQLSMQSILSQLIVDVTKTYRAYAKATNSVLIANLSLERSKAQQQTTRQLILSGRLPRVEQIQADSDVANQQFNFESTQNALISARTALLRLLSLNADTDIKTQDPLQTSRLQLDFVQVRQQILADRQDYQLALLAQQDAEQNLLLAKNNYLWQLDAVLNYQISGSGHHSQFPGDQLGSLSQGDYGASLTLSIPLNDRSSRRDIIAAKVALRQANNNLATIKENIELQISRIERSIDLLWRQVELAEKALDASRLQLKMEQAKQASGRTSNFQLISYQNALREAESQYLDTRIDYLNAVTDIDLVLGKTLQRWQHLMPTNNVSTANALVGTALDTRWSL